MVTKIRSLGIRGIGGYEVSVECALAQGLPEFNIVGLPDTLEKIVLHWMAIGIENKPPTNPSSGV